MKAGFFSSVIYILLVMLIIPGMAPGMASAIDENSGDSGNSVSDSGSSDTGNSVSDSGSSDTGDSVSDSESSDTGDSVSDSGSSDTGDSVSDSGSSDTGDSVSDSESSDTDQGNSNKDSGDSDSSSDSGDSTPSSDDGDSDSGSSSGDSDSGAGSGNSTPISDIVDEDSGSDSGDSGSSSDSVDSGSSSDSADSGSSSDSADSGSGSDKKTSDSSSVKSVTKSDTGKSDTVSSSSGDSDTQNQNNTDSDTESSDSEDSDTENQSSNSSSDSVGMNLVSNEPAGNIVAKELSTRSIMGGYPVRFDFVKNITCITSIEFDPKKTFRKTTTVVEELKNQSALVPTPSPGTVYKYVNIWVGDKGAGLPTSIRNGYVEFRVKKTWIKDNNVNETLVTLERYDEDWQSLYTEKIGEDENYVYFKAETPGYSSFAITEYAGQNGNMREIHGAEKIQETLKTLGSEGKAVLSGNTKKSIIKNPMGLGRTVMAILLPVFMIVVGYCIIKKKI